MIRTSLGILQIQNTVILVIMCIFLSACSRVADNLLNDVYDHPPYTADTNAITLHNNLALVDLHADSLMWERNLLEHSSRGHIDVPRLLKGNVTLQVFSVVTGVPYPVKIENNNDKRDMLDLLAYLQGWPEVTHHSRFQRALFQANKLKRIINESKGKLLQVKTKQDLQTLLKQRATGKKVIGSLLSLEGAHALEGKVENINELYKTGFRILGLTHHFDNAMAGSTHGVKKYGLTDKGRQLIRRANELGMIFDLSHSSSRTIDDVISMVDRPVITSHGGVRGTCDTARNLQDKHIHAIAKTGGVIGIGLFQYATCGKTLNDTVLAIRYITDMVGVEHVALGSDFDGSVKTVFDASGWVKLTEALQKAGYTENDIRAIMGGNALRIFLQILPTK